MTLSVSQKLIDLQKERDAFSRAKAGVTAVMLDYIEKSRSLLTDPAVVKLQQLIDLADRRIKYCTQHIKCFEEVLGD